MLLLSPSPNHTDVRGAITDLLGKVDAVTEITTRKGAIRGNHYHHDTTQWTYVVKGRLRVVTETLPGAPIQGVLRAGELMESPPGERHAWQALVDTTVLVFTQGPRSGADYETDVTRLEDESRLIG